MPSRAMRAGGRPAISRSSNITLPALGSSSPEIRLTRVVLPAPLGPITAWIRPARKASDTPSTAARPPKRRAKPRTTRTGSTTFSLRPLYEPAQAARQKQHRQDDDDAQRQEPMPRRVGQRVLQQHQ